MAQTIQILRSNVNTPPGALLAGAFSAEFGPRTKLWIGSPSGNRLLLSSDPADNAITIGAPIDSPIFTGNPQAPTPLAGDSDFSIATTAFVHNALGSYLPLVGGVLSGTLNISTTTSAALLLNKAVGTFSNYVIGYRATITRWAVEFGNSTAEAGANSGSDFTISRYDDVGTFLGTPLSINRATGVVTAGTMNAAQYNVGGKIFATSDGTTTSIYDPTGVGAIYLQATVNFYDADTHLFRNNTGGVNTAAIDNVGNLTIGGFYIHFGGTPGTVNTTGGPLLYADGSNHVYKLGVGNANWFFQNYAGTTVASITAAGALNLLAGINTSSINVSGLLAANSINSASTINGTQYNINGIPFANSNGTTVAILDNTGGPAIYLQASTNFYDADTHQFRNNVGANTASINSVGTFTTTGEIIAGGNLHAGQGLLLGNPYILFNGNTSLSQGPYLQVDGTNWIQRLGAGAGAWYFQNSAGSNLAWIDSAGNISSPLLQGGVGGGGTLRGIPTADPQGHAISFGWSGLIGGDGDQVLYLNIDGSRTSLIPWSDTIKSMLIQADGGAPTGWHLAVITGGLINYFYSDVASDSRLKQGIVDSEIDALAALCAIPIRRYEWRDEVQKTFGVPQGPVECGLVAQDLLPTMPDCVGVSEGRPAPYPADTHVIRHERFDAYFIRAIQQLTARVAVVEGKGG